MVFLRHIYKGSALAPLVLLFILPLFIHSANATSPQLIPQLANNVLLPDGSFEEIPSLWREQDNTGCTPWIGDWSFIDGFPTAFDGSQYFWAGGECGPPTDATANRNLAEQYITIQPIDTTLSFWYYANRTDADGLYNDDYAYIKINGNEIWQLDMIQANNSTNWVNVTLPISQYAGTTVKLTVGAVNGNRAGVGNVFFDLFETRQDIISQPAISIAKGPDSQTIGLNETAVFSIDVTNTGNTTLFDIQITDPLTPDCNQNFPQLASGESTTYSCQQNNVTANFTNTAEVTALTADATPVSHSDTADVIINNPGMVIGLSPETQTIAENGTATFTLTMTNTGNIKLNSINISSPTTPDCNNTLPSLAPQAVYTFPVCTRTNVTQSYLNTVTANANALSDSLTATDEAFVDVLDSQIAIVINPDAQTINKGNSAVFDIFVFNIGNADLTNIQITSQSNAACNNSFATLIEGAHTSYSCTISNVAAAFTHEIMVTATNTQANIQVQDTDFATVDVLDVGLTITAVTPAKDKSVRFMVIFLTHSSMIEARVVPFFD